MTTTWFLTTHMAPPSCCGQPMEWDVWRAIHVCMACGATR